LPGAETSPAEDLALIRDAAREAGGIAMRYFKNKQEIWMKGGTSPVGEADYAVDLFLRETLTAARPYYGWLSEETTDTPARLGASRTFVVDPIDGTRAFIDGQNIWCVSIGVVEGGRPIAGVLDCPAKNEVFAAALGAGSTRNGVALKIGAAPERPLVGGPKHLLATLPDNLAETVRRAGYIPSLAYRLAMVASGELTATFVKANSHDWDLAAADLVLSEAGGAILDRRGLRLSYAGAVPRHAALAAGSGPLLDQLVEALARAGAEAA
jgi:myo-inositol-1(or 4)-monophosphatase